MQYNANASPRQEVLNTEETFSPCMNCISRSSNRDETPTCIRDEPVHGRPRTAQVSRDPECQDPFPPAVKPIL